MNVERISFPLSKYFSKSLELNEIVHAYELSDIFSIFFCISVI